MREAIDAGWSIVEFFVTGDYDFGFAHDSSWYVLDERTFVSVADVSTPQGVMAVVSMSAPFLETPLEDGWLLVADSISDPGNLGTIIRSAEAAGASRVVLVDETVDPFSPKVVRSSAGAMFHIPVGESSFARLKADRYRLLGLTSHTSVSGSATTSIYDVSVDGRIAVVVGSEASGISADAPIDDWITIPHVGRAESLNAAMAATVMCMHVARTRSQSVRRREGDVH